jgi:hypothetical protein
LDSKFEIRKRGEGGGRWQRRRRGAQGLKTESTGILDSADGNGRKEGAMGGEDTIRGGGAERGLRHCLSAWAEARRLRAPTGPGRSGPSKWCTYLLLSFVRISVIELKVYIS